MASIIARALYAHEVQLNQEREAQQQREKVEAAALTALLERVGPFYTEQLGLVLDEQLPPMNWVDRVGSATFVDRSGTLEAQVDRLEAELFGVTIVVTPVPTAQTPCTFAVRPTSKADNGPVEFSNLAEFGAAVRAHYPLVAADHGNN